MSPRFILAFFRIAVSILLYLLICVSLFVLVTFVVNLFDHRKSLSDTPHGTSFHYEVKNVSPQGKALPFAYSADSLVRYRAVGDRYAVEVEGRSAMGYYLQGMKMLLLGFGIAILWNFRQLFRRINLEMPFRHEVIKRLKVLALLFIIADVVKLADYFVFDFLLQGHVREPRFELLTTAGDGIITGLVIYLIVVVFQHGIALQEENALTV